MPLKRRRSPQEKKALSYAKDCRDTYRGSNKARRKGIPRRKALENQRRRKKTKQGLARMHDVSEAEFDVIQSSVKNGLERYGSGAFAKGSDGPLGDHLERQRDLRQWRDGRKKWVRKKTAEAEKKGQTGFSWSWRGSEVTSFFDSH